MFKVNNKDIIKTLAIDISIVDFEQVNTGWVLKYKKVYFSKDRKCGPKKSLIYRHSKNHSFFYPCLGKIDLKIISDLDFILNTHKNTFIILWIFLFSETLLMDRSSREDVFCENCVLKNFAKFTGKHVRLSRWPVACNFIKKETLAQMFPVNFAKFLGTPFLTEHLRWVLLDGNNV